MSTSTKSPTPIPSSPISQSSSSSDLHRRRSSAISQTKVIVVSNRLPITLTYNADGQPQLKKSSGGLVTALQGTHLRDVVWVGSAGESPLTPAARELVLSEGFVPVDLDPKLYHLFYSGFSNSVLWSMFHYMLDTDECTFTPEIWEAYQKCNQAFAEVVTKEYTENCFVWVHDYHLLLLPKYIRDRIPDSRIGLFFHIVWPSSEIFRALPVRSEVLEGMLGADLIGFHTFSYAKHFLSTCVRLLGATATATLCKYRGRTTYVSAFPIGIDPHMFDMRTFSQEQQGNIMHEIKRLEAKHKDLFIICGVDRLDYIKGIPFKLAAYKRFLEKHPEVRGKVVLIQVGVPTRENVTKYQQLMDETNKLVGSITGDFATLEWTPIVYIHSSVQFHELIALYTISQAMMITSIRDGMNLVALEYVVAQKNTKNPGVLILSEFAGCASSLSGSIRINPWDVDETANALKDALVMSSDERHERHALNYSFVADANTAEKWADKFLTSAVLFSTLKPDPKCSPLDLLSFTSDYIQGKRRLLLLDYDGTLVEFHRRPELAKPSQNLLDTLSILTSSPLNVVYVISGRHRKDLLTFFDGIDNLGLVAEHGMVFRPPSQSEFSDVFTEPFDKDWMDEVRPLMKTMATSTPGAFVEEKPASLCFHYRNVIDKDFARYQVHELHSNILDVLHDTATIDFCFGNNVFEVRCKGANKGEAVLKLLEFHGSFDFIFCVGDDSTDEGMFDLLFP
ncbi:hypothetical protein RCL1_001696 [Eukaryota sp. TZLM3-RCL]